MNKLVSKNPIQRFKEGKKILFAKWGDKADYPIPIKDLDGYYFGEWTGGGIVDGTKIIRDTEQVRLKDKDEPFYSKSHYFPGPYTKMIRDKLLNSFNVIPRDLTRSYDATNSKPIINSSMNQKQKSQQISKENSTSNKTSNRVSILNNYGLVGGVQKGWKGQKGIIDDKSFTDLQSLGYSGERNARAAQEWINNNLSKYGIVGSVATDNAWGEQSNRALKMMLSTFEKPNISSDPLYPINDTETINNMKAMITQQTPSIDEQSAVNAGNNPNLKFTPTTFNFNKAQTRDWLRQNFGSAYSLTGAQRAAVRNVLGGKSTDQDRNLIAMNQQLFDLMKNKGYYKQGGQFLSRNVIERFKNNINKN